MSTLKAASRRLGNYGECTITIEKQPDGTLDISTQVSCPYGSEWPFAMDGSFDLAPFGPALREMAEELDLLWPEEQAT